MTPHEEQLFTAALLANIRKAIAAGLEATYKGKTIAFVYWLSEQDGYIDVRMQGYQNKQRIPIEEIEISE